MTMQPMPGQPHAGHRRRGPVIVAVGAVAAGLALGLGISAATGTTTVVPGHGSAATSNPAQPADMAATTATSEQEVGVVDIDTVLKYQGAEAAGTGMILTSSGEVLTNNHVVNGATSIQVTVVSTGKTYPATVVGTDPTDDVAVLQLRGASGLATARMGDSSDVDAGDSVTAGGNAGGAGGTPSAASGTVVATDQTLTAGDQNGTNAERLTGMIEIDAALVPGESGGPLYDSADDVIGMNTAASTGYVQRGYAIPIDKALGIADRIETGDETSTIHIGYPAFLGVGVADSFDGAAVTGVADATPAAQAGLRAGDVITAVGGKAIASAADVANAIGGHDPGDRVAIAWTDTAGRSHTATVTLATGPAD